MYYFRNSLLLVTFSYLLSSCSATLQHQNKQQAVPDAEFVKQLVEQKIIAPEKIPVPQKRYYTYGLADLNNNGHQEIYILMQNPYFCGSGGCSGYLFDDKGQIISEMTVTREPILVADQTTNGWKDLYVWSDRSLRIMKFDGKRYPANPSMEPKTSLHKEEAIARKKVMSWETYQQDGYQLQPATDIPLLQPAYIFTFSFLHYGDPDFEYRATIDTKTGQEDMRTHPIKP